MNKHIIIIAIFLISIMSAPSSVRCAGNLEIADIHVTGRSPGTTLGLMVGETFEFSVNIRNTDPDTAKSGQVLISVDGITVDTINVTVAKGEIRTLSGLRYKSTSDGAKTITIILYDANNMVIDTKTDNGIRFFNFIASTSFEASSYYPTIEGQKRIVGRVTINNNGTESTTFSINYKLLDNKGTPHTTTLSSSPPVSITGSGDWNGSAPNKITLGGGSTGVLYYEYTLVTNDAPGTWVGEVEIKPFEATYNSKPIRSSKATTLVLSPDVVLSIRADDIYEIGKAMKFQAVLTNGSSVPASVDVFSFAIKDSNYQDKINSDVDVYIGGTFQRSAFNVDVPANGASTLDIEVVISKDLKDKFTNETHWKSTETYTIDATAQVQGKTGALTTREEVSFKPFNPSIKVEVTKPSIYLFGDATEIEVVLVNERDTPQQNVTIEFGLVDPTNINVAPPNGSLQPSRVDGISLGSFIWGEGGGTNRYAVTLKATGLGKEGVYKLYYALNGNKEFMPEPITINVSKEPLRHSLNITPPPSADLGQFQIRSPMSVQFNVVNDGTYSESYQVYAEVTLGGQNQKVEKSYYLGDGSLSPKQTSSLYTMSIPTSELDAGEKLLKVYLLYNGQKVLISTSEFEIIYPLANGYEYTETMVATPQSVVVGQSGTVTVSVKMNPDIREGRHFNVEVRPSNQYIGLSEGREFSRDILITDTTMFPSIQFTPTSGAIGQDNYFQLIINGQVRQQRIPINIVPTEQAVPNPTGEGFPFIGYLIGIGAIVLVLGYVFRKKIFGQKPQKTKRSDRIREEQESVV
jgi:hypothetical protein